MERSILKRFILLLFFCGVLIGNFSLRAAPEKSVLLARNFIFASVNGEVITSDEVLRLTGTKEQQARAVYSGERLETVIYNYRKDAVNDLIDDILVQAEFSRYNYTLSKQDIEREIDRIGTAIGCRSREQLIRRLQKEGSGMEELEMNARKKLMVQMMIYRQLRIADPISPQEVYEYFQANESSYSSAEKIGLAMLKLDSARTDLEKVSAEITAELSADPGKFEEFVRRYNPELGSGDLGEIDRKLLRPEFAAAFEEFQVGLVAGPIKVYDGVVWLKITSWKPAQKPVFKEVEERIKSDLQRKKQEKILEDYIQQLRNGAVIEYFL